MLPTVLVPMRWPAEADWHKPDALSLLEGSPINCLVVSAKNPPRPALLKAANDKQLAIVSLDGPLPGATQIPAAPAGAINSKMAAPVVGIAESVWPGVKLSERGRAEAAPTGPPWVDSNGWMCLLARARAGNKALWVIADPPPEVAITRPSAYEVALADAAAHGARWVLSLGPEMTKPLASRDAAAMTNWKALLRAVLLFEQQAAWRTYPTMARLGVISDFEGANEFLAHEIMNLAPRRYLACRPVDLPAFKLAALDGLKAVVWILENPPAGEHLNTLMAFVSRGGMVILSSNGAPLAAKLGPGTKHKTGYRVYPSGQGYLAIAPEEWSDPYVLASDAHLLMSRRHDTYRIFNSGAMNVHCTSAPNGAAVAHIINYAGRTTYNPVSFYLAKPYKSARWTNLQTNLEKLDVKAANEGVEVNLPAFTSYAGIEFGGQS